MPLHTLAIDTPGRGFTRIDAAVQQCLTERGAETGLVTVFLRHTSASLLIQENADPDVLGDLERFIAKLVPDGDALFHHTDEGPDDMPSHVRTALTQTSISIPYDRGRLLLGTWQGLYLWEHRHRAHRRQIVLHVAEG